MPGPDPSANSRHGTRFEFACEYASRVGRRRKAQLLGHVPPKTEPAVIRLISDQYNPFPPSRFTGISRHRKPLGSRQSGAKERGTKPFALPCRIDSDRSRQQRGHAWPADTHRPEPHGANGKAVRIRHHQAKFANWQNPLPQLVGGKTSPGRTEDPVEERFHGHEIPPGFLPQNQLIHGARVQERGALARRSRSLTAAPSPRSGIARTAMQPLPPIAESNSRKHENKRLAASGTFPVRERLRATAACRISAGSGPNPSHPSPGAGASASMRRLANGA